MIEALVTVLALEGLLPGVHSQVGSMVAWQVEGETAELTHMLLHASVHHGVSFQVDLIWEFQSTMGAGKSFGAPVFSQVSIACMDFGKFRGTVGACIWF